MENKDIFELFSSEQNSPKDAVSGTSGSKDTVSGIPSSKEDSSIKCLDSFLDQEQTKIDIETKYKLLKDEERTNYVEEKALEKFLESRKTYLSKNENFDEEVRRKTYIKYYNSYIKSKELEIEEASNARFSDVAYSLLSKKEKDDIFSSYVYFEAYTVPKEDKIFHEKAISLINKNGLYFCAPYEHFNLITSKIKKEKLGKYFESYYNKLSDKEKEDIFTNHIKFENYNHNSLVINKIEYNYYIYKPYILNFILDKINDDYIKFLETKFNKMNLKDKKAMLDKIYIPNKSTFSIGDYPNGFKLLAKNGFYAIDEYECFNFIPEKINEYLHSNEEEKTPVSKEKP